MKQAQDWLHDPLALVGGSGNYIVLFTRDTLRLAYK